MAEPLREEAPGPEARSQPGGRFRSALEIWTTPLPELPGWHRHFLYRLVLTIFGPLLTVENPEALAAIADPVLFACNHSNAVEAVLVPTLIAFLRGGRRVTFLADWMFLHLPPFGWLLRLNGVIPIYRKRARFGLREQLRRERQADSPLAAAAALLAGGKSVGIFPEGTRNPDPERLLRGRSGVGALAVRSGVPVVPVGLRYPAAARLGHAPAIGRLIVTFGAPLYFPAARAASQTGSPDTAPDRWRSRQATARVMAALAQLSGKRFPQRPSEAP